MHSFLTSFPRRHCILLPHLSQHSPLLQFLSSLSYPSSPPPDPKPIHRRNKQTTPSTTAVVSTVHPPQNQSPPPLFYPESVVETISSYANDWARALEFFHWVESEHGFRHTAATYNRTIDVLGKFFEFDLAWRLIHRMTTQNDALLPDHSTFRILFNRYAAAHLVREASEAFDRSAEYGLRDQIGFHHLIDALCEHRHAIEAEELCLEKHSEFLADTKTHNMLLRGWYKMGWWRKCREFWEEMDRKGVEKDLVSYSIYMHVLSKSGKPWRAVKLYREMKKNRIFLDVVAYNTVLQAIGLSNGVDESIGLYREMMDLGCRPNVVTYNIIIKLLCRSGRVRDAYAFLDQMQKKGCEPNVITYHCFFQYLNRPKEILELFERMVRRRCQPRMDTYVMLMKKFGRWGFLRPVFIVWRALEAHGLSPDGFAYNALIDALLQKGRIELAQKYDQEMLAKGLSAKPRKELGTKRLTEDSDDNISGVF